MTKINIPIAVASRSFSKNSELKSKLQETFSNIKYNDPNAILSGKELVQFLKGSIAAIIGLEPVDSKVLTELPDLKFISKYGVGLDNIDQSALKKHGVKLGWTGGVNRRSVSELTLTFAIGLCRKIFFHSDLLRHGKWKVEPSVQLSDKTVGIIGCGFVGKDVAKLLQPFGCEVLAHDIVHLDKSSLYKQVSFEELLKNSDIVTIHVPYDTSTHHMISENQLGRMKKSAYLINTSRGNVVDEVALLNALNSGQVAGAAADVFAIEPAPQNPLLKHPHFVGTPHIGGSSKEAVAAMGGSAIKHLLEFFAEQK